MEPIIESNKPTRLTKILYNTALFIIGIALGAMLFSHCERVEPASNNIGNELERQYDELKINYGKLLVHDSSITIALNKANIELVAIKAESKKQLSYYAKTYTKGRDVIINNPCKDSIHLAAYDSLNLSCERTQEANGREINKYVEIVSIMEQKVANRDSVIGNRNSVISLDSTKISAYKDSLRTSKIVGRKRAVKSFFLGLGVGAALREAAGVAVKVLDKR